MRYRNRIKIAPGIQINLSASGISTTLGPQGANINIGKNGSYLNTGIPGTGLYNRTKISKSNRTNSSRAVVNQGQVGVKMDLDEAYNPVLQIFDKSGNDITHPTLISRVKRTPEYKENLREIYRLYYQDIITETTDFTDVYKNTLKPVQPIEVQSQLDNLKPKRFKLKPFDKPKPTEDSTRIILEVEAKSKINSLLFWTNKSNRALYVKENLEVRLNNAIEKWTKEKGAFEKEQALEANEKNAQYLEEYKLTKDALEKNLEGASEHVIGNFQEILNEVVIKPEFHLDFEYDETIKVFHMDLDLPVVEHIPTKTASLLQSGKLSVKKKSEKLIREDYARTVTGLAFLIAGMAFMSASGIREVKLGGYTQRVDPKDGQLKDDYIFKIRFDRPSFSDINFTAIDPIRAFENFEHEMILSKTFVFKSID